VKYVIFPLLLLLLLLLKLTSCELFELPMDVEPAEEKLVLSSLMLGDNTILVAATRSFSALSAESLDDLEQDFVEAIMVSRGRATLRSGRDDLELRQFGLPGFYLGDPDFLSPGDSLHISLFDSLKGQSVSATTRLMEPVAIDSAGMDLYEAGEFAFRRLSIRFQDLPYEQFFQLQVYNATSASLFEEPDSLFFPQDNLVLHSSVFTDLTAQDGVIRREVMWDADLSGDTVVAVLSHIEEGYFRFLDARRRFGGIVASLANEPINLPGNVEGGYGYFSAHHPRAIIVIRNSASVPSEQSDSE